jgi:hypothetical protein
MLQVRPTRIGGDVRRDDHLGARRRRTAGADCGIDGDPVHGARIGGTDAGRCPRDEAPERCVGPHRARRLLPRTARSTLVDQQDRCLDGPLALPLDHEAELRQELRQGASPDDQLEHVPLGLQESVCAAHLGRVSSISLMCLRRDGSQGHRLHCAPIAQVDPPAIPTFFRDQRRLTSRACSADQLWGGQLPNRPMWA